MAFVQTGGLIENLCVLVIIFSCPAGGWGGARLRGKYGKGYNKSRSHTKK
jgi:hypothetical protein